MARNFDNWLKAYMHHTRASEAPNEFHFWAGVSTIAGALRRRVWIEQYIYQWTPNFYIVLVSPAGIATKSTTISLGTSLLRQVDGIHFGPESMTWQFLQADFAKASEYFTWQDSKGKDQTTPMAALTIPISELGTFLRTEDAALMSFLTRMWDGQKDTFAHGTLSSGKIVVENPWLNIIGATTPTWLRNNFPENLIGEGLTSRVVFVYAEHKRQFVAYPSTVVRGDNFFEHEAKLVADLKEIASLAGPYEMTNEALLWGEDWYRKLWTSRPVHLASERYSGYISRKQTHVHKLAIVLAAAKRSVRVIEKEDLVEADMLLTDIEKHMIRVFESMGVVTEARHVQEIVAFVRAHGFMTSNDLWVKCNNVMPRKEFVEALRMAVENGILEKTTQNGALGVVVAKRTVN